MQNIPARVIIAFCFAVVASIVLGSLILVYAKREMPVRIGDVAPNIKTVTVHGQPFALNTLRGRPILLDFFTPWCPPCIAETPDLISFSKKYGKVVDVVLIDRGDGTGLVQQYIQKYHVPSEVTVLLDPRNRWSPPYGVTGQPETFFITPNGTIVSHTVGPLSEGQMVQYALASGIKLP